MNKDEALKLALEALDIQAYNSGDEKYTQAITAIKQALVAPVQEPCRHRVADARNPVVKSGYLCIDCGALFSAADHDKPPFEAQPAPVQGHVATLIEHYAFTDGIVRFDGVENMEPLPVGTKFYTTPPAQPAPTVQEPAPDWDAWNLISRLNKALEEIGDYAHDKSTGPAVPDALWEVRSMAYDAIEEATPPAAQPAPVQEPVGITTGCASHPGFFTVVMRSSEAIPEGTKLYTTPPATPVQPVQPVLEVVNGKINRAWDAIPVGFTGMLYMQSPLNVPLKKPQEPWYGSARVDDYNRGWNDCVDSIDTTHQTAHIPQPWGTYMGHRMTPEGTKEFWGFADAPIPEGTKLYTTPPAAQPAPVQEPVAWAVFADNGNIRIWSTIAEEVRTITKTQGLKISPLYTTPPAAPVKKTVWTEAQHKRAYRNSPELHKDVKSLAAFKRVAKEIASMYGIEENT